MMLPAIPHRSDIVMKLYSLSLRKKDASSLENRVSPFPHLSAGWDFRWAITLLALILLPALLGCAKEEETVAKHLQNARNYIANNEFKVAVIELKNVVQLNPQNDEAHFLLGETYMKLDQVSSAAQSYISAVTANPNNLKAQLKLGQLLLAAKQTMQAKKAAKLILEKVPNDIDALRLLSAVQLQENNAPEAIKTLQKAVDVAPQDTTLRLFLAYLSAASGDLDKSEKEYQQVITMESSNPAGYAALANLYARKGDWGKAEAVIDQMHQTSGKGYRELSAFAQFCENSGKLDIAEKAYLKAAESAPAGETAPLVALGAYYARRQSFEKALATMQNALNIKQDDPTILSNIARVHLELNNIDAAEAATDKALKLNSENILANYTKGRLFFLKKDFKSALDRFDQTIRDDPDNYMAHYYRALCLMGKGARGRSDSDLFRAAAGFQNDDNAWIEKAAIDSLNNALKLNPRLLEAQLTLADLYLRKRDTEKARQQIESALALAPGHSETLMLQGGLKIMQGDLKGAETVCLKAIHNTPNNSLWQLRLGIVYNLMKRPEEALQSFKKAIELNPLELDALQLMAGIHMQQNNYEQALNVCEKHKIRVSGNPTAVAIIDNLEGKILLARGETEKARQHFEKAIASGPDVIAPRMALAELNSREKQFDTAITQYEAVLALNPNYLPACMALGDTHYIRGEKKKAEKYYRQALVIEGAYGPAANNLAFLLSSDDNKLREALDFANIAEKKMPQDANAKDTLGWIQYRMGNYYVAITEFERSLSLNPNAALTHYHLGLAYYKNSEFDKARKQFRKALKLDPGFEGASEAKTLLDE
jgi:pentatricopeptide repeat protein